MIAVLLGGSHDGTTVNVSDSLASVTVEQTGERYYKVFGCERAGVFAHTSIHAGDVYKVLARRLVEFSDLRQRVGMARAQLDDAGMYLGRFGETLAKKHVKTAQEHLRYEQQPTA